MYQEAIHVDNSSFHGVCYKHLLRYQTQYYDETFTDNGIFDINSPGSNWNIVEILPLNKPEQLKSDTHPSVAWWESCPWITDRKPTEEDGDYLGQVIQQVSSKARTTLDLSFNSWAYVKEGKAWIHTLNWRPVKQTPKEKALALIAKHRAGWDIHDNWIPTPDDWIIIREGLTE